MAKNDPKFLNSCLMTITKLDLSQRYLILESNIFSLLVQYIIGTKIFLSPKGSPGHNYYDNLEEVRGWKRGRMTVRAFRLPDRLTEWMLRNARMPHNLFFSFFPFSKINLHKCKNCKCPPAPLSSIS